MGDSPSPAIRLSLIRPWAFAVSLILHGSAAAWMLVQLEDEPPGAATAGRGGLEVAVGPLAGAMGGAVAPVTDLPEAETVPVTEAIDAVPAEPIEPIDGTIEAATVEAAEAERLETFETTDPAKIVEPMDAEAVEPVAADLLEPTEVMVVEPVEAVTADPVEPTAAEVAEAAAPPPEETVKAVEVAEATAHTPPVPPPPSKPTPPAAAPDPVAAAAASAEPAVDGPTDTASLEGRPSESAGRADAEAAGGSGGRPGALPDYLALVSAWFERHKEYPRRAQLRRQEGTVLLRFTVDRTGRVLSYAVERSSGYALLDRAVEELIGGAKSLPPMPDDMAVSQLELAVPIDFDLR